MRFFLQCVKGHAGGLQYYPVAQTPGNGIETNLGRFELLAGRDITSLTKALTQNADITQSGGSVLRFGSLSLKLDNADGRFSPGNGILGGGQFGHRLNLENDDGSVVYWAGLSRDHQIGAGGSADIEFRHILDGLDDEIIPGDETLPAITAERWTEFIDDLEEALCLTFDATTRAAIIATSNILEPPSDIAGRKFWGQVAISKAAILTAGLNAADPCEMSLIGYLSRDGVARGLPVIRFLTHHILGSVRYDDEKKRCHNLMEFDYFEGDERRSGVERGRVSMRSLAASRRHYGLRELKLDLPPMRQTAAANVADTWATLLFRTRRRVNIKVALPPARLALGSVVRLEVDRSNNSLNPLWGFFFVMGLRMDIVDEAADLSLVEMGPEHTDALLAEPVVDL